MSAPKGVCVQCGKYVEHYESAAYAVTGYELERKQGGANRIYHKQRVDNFIAHARSDYDCLHHWIKRHESQGEQTSLV